MKEQTIKRWAKALLSGKYEQTQGSLCTEDGKMCCLGVLIDTEFDGDWVLLQRDVTNTPRYTMLGNGGTPPVEVQYQLGISLELEDLCVRANDDQHKSFKEIAEALLNPRTRIGKAARKGYCGT